MNASSVDPFTPADWALIGIDPQTIALVFAWGFASVVSFWAMGYVIGVAIQLIRKL